MAHTKKRKARRTRRSYSEDFKQEAVQMLLDGHSAPSVAQRLGLSGPNVLYGWKKAVLHRAGPAARTLGDRVAQLEDELRFGGVGDAKLFPIHALAGLRVAQVHQQAVAEVAHVIAGNAQLIITSPIAV